MGLEQILSNYAYTFLLIMARYSGIFIITPVLGSNVIPIRVKVSFSFFLAVVTAPLIEKVAFPNHSLIIISNVTRELGIGFILGFVLFLAFISIQLAGSFIDLRIGFAMVNIIDPLSGMTAPLTGQLKNIFATLIFLIIDGHHVIIQALHYSFEKVPLGKMVLTDSSIAFLLRLIGDIFIISFQIALPIIGALFIADVVFGFLARSMPQMNIFMIGLPVKIILGIIILILSTGFMVNYFGELFAEAFKNISNIIKLLYNS
ncbi:MAG: flagellar biosynthetic protein FliR [bacterium]